MAQLAQSWSHVRSPNQEAAAPDPVRYCFVLCNGYPGCSAMSLKPASRHVFFLLIAYQPPNTTENTSH